MNGDRYLVDTNAIVSLLQGDTKLAHLLENADWVGISVISQVEFLAFSGLSHLDRQLFQTFLQKVEVIDLTSTDTELIEKIIEMHQRFRLKLPDAIIAAMAIQNSAGVVTADQAFTKVTILTVINW